MFKRGREPAADAEPLDPMEKVKEKVMEKMKIESIIDREMDLLEEVKSRLLNLQGRMDTLERKMTAVGDDVSGLKNEMKMKVPAGLLSEQKFLDELKGSDEAFDRFLNEVKGMIGTKSAREIIAEKLAERVGGNAGEKIGENGGTTWGNNLNNNLNNPSIVESKRIERITMILQQHGKLSSSQLSELTGLSRTRCNEYFKQMEELGIVEPMTVGKEKFYVLS